MFYRSARAAWHALVPERTRGELFARKVDRGLTRKLIYGFGLHRSLVDQACVDASGAPLPWYTFPMIEFLDQHDFSKARVFECGSGNSTRYWAQRAKLVVSVEHDEEWHRRMSTVLAGQTNVEITHAAEPRAYIEHIRTRGRFDVIVIDGEQRVETARSGMACREDGGIIILDNADGYTDVAQILREEGGLLQIDFNGFGPFNSVPWRTSMFMKDRLGFARLPDGKRRFEEAYL